MTKMGPQRTLYYVQCLQGSYRISANKDKTPVNLDLPQLLEKHRKRLKINGEIMAGMEEMIHLF